MIGRRLGQFQIESELGSGGMGTVYRARDLTLRRIVAVKTLPAGTLTPERRSRLLAEARAASALNHPSIVTIYQVGVEDDVDFVAMELVEGRTLAEVVAEGPVDERRVHRWSVELAEALAVAHRTGIVHRDLKPGNVMVGPSDALKVLDFGLAKQLPTSAAELGDDSLPTLSAPPRTATGAVLGTPAYMSPEQARGAAVDHRSDLFSLGCVLYELLTGRRPFEGGSSVELLSAILRDAPAPVARIRPGLELAWAPILDRLLAKDAGDRYADADELAADLRSLVAHGQRSERPARWLPPVVVAGAAALAIAGLAWLWLRPGHGPSNEVSADFPTYRYRLAADLPGSQSRPSLSPDGRMVAFEMADAAGIEQIWVLNLSGGDPIRITAGDRPAGAPSWAPSGDRILFHREHDGIWTVPPLGGDAHQLLSTGTFPVASADGGRIAYNAGRRLWIAAGDGSEPRPVARFEPTFFGYFARPAFAPDGRRLVTFWPHPERPLGDLWIVDLDGGTRQRLTDLGFLSWGTAPTWTADGAWIVFSSDHGGAVNLWRIAPDGAEPLPVTSGAGSDYSPELSADLDRLVYANGRSTARIIVHDPATGDTRVGYEKRDLAITPRVSPDGDRIAFFARDRGGIHLFVADLETGEARQVTVGDRQLDTHPAWSADGRTLYFYRQPIRGEAGYSYRRISVDGRREEQLLDDWHWTTRHQAHPSPDEQRIVYLVRDAGRNVEARVRDLETGEEHALPLPLYDPLWTPDGGEIYGATWDPYRIHFCSADGSGCREVADGWAARLGPDGDTLFTLRGDPPQVWRVDLATGEQEYLVTVEPYDAVDFGWGVRPDGGVVYHTQHNSDLELWLGEAVDATAD